MNELGIADVTIEITMRSKGMMVGTVVVPLAIEDTALNANAKNPIRQLHHHDKTTRVAANVKKSKYKTLWLLSPGQHIRELISKSSKIAA